MSSKFLAVIVLLAVTACSRAPDELRIRTAVTQMAEAVEARRPSDFMAWIAGDFTGNEGRFDRDQLARFLRAMVMGNQSLHVALGSIDVKLANDRATVTFVATVSGSSGRWLPERGEETTIVSGWRLQDGEWLCYNARWTGAAADRLSRGMP